MAAALEPDAAQERVELTEPGCPPHLEIHPVERRPGVLDADAEEVAAPAAGLVPGHATVEMPGHAGLRHRLAAEFAGALGCVHGRILASRSARQRAAIAGSEKPPEG
jgi:hypothetical protein